jgi:hypothetical protein
MDGWMDGAPGVHLPSLFLDACCNSVHSRLAGSSVLPVCVGGGLPVCPRVRLSCVLLVQWGDDVNVPHKSWCLGPDLHLSLGVG